MIRNTRHEIWLVRHGQSDSNAGMRTLAPQTSKLTELGRRQVNLFAEKVDKSPELIVISPYLRAQESAQPLISKFSAVRVEEWPIQEFTYLSASAYAGTTVTERRPLIEAYWRENDPARFNPGAESFSGFFQRVNSMIDRMRATSGFTVIFSHGHILRLAWQLLSIGPAATLMQQMQFYNHLRQAVAVPNGALLKLTFTPGREVWMSNFINPVSLHSCEGRSDPPRF